LILKNCLQITHQEAIGVRPGADGNSKGNPLPPQELLLLCTPVAVLIYETCCLLQTVTNVIL